MIPWTNWLMVWLHVMGEHWKVIMKEVSSSLFISVEPIYCLVNLNQAIQIWLFPDTHAGNSMMSLMGILCIVERQLFKIKWLLILHNLGTIIIAMVLNIFQVYCVTVHIE